MTHYVLLKANKVLLREKYGALIALIKIFFRINYLCIQSKTLGKYHQNKAEESRQKKKG